MLEGILTKLFPIRSNSSNDGKQLISSGSSPSMRLQLLRFSFVKEYSVDREDSIKVIGQGFLGSDRKEKREYHDLGAGPLHPSKDSTLSFFQRPKVDGSCVIAVLPTSSSSRFITFPNISGNFSSLKHPYKLRILRVFNSHMFVGRQASFTQSFKFKKTSPFRIPIESSILTSFLQPSRFSFSRFGTCLKSGVFIKFRECLRSIALSNFKGCQKIQKENQNDETLNTLLNLK